MDKTNFTKLFAEFDRDAPPRFRAMRETARARFMEMLWPTTRTEDWRFTNIAPVVETPYELGQSNVGKQPMHLVPSDLSLHYCDGHPVSILSRITSDLQLGWLSEERFNPTFLTKIANDRENVFTALNTSFLSHGAFVFVPDDLVLELPIKIDFGSFAREKALVSHPRTLIVLGKNARATVIERYWSPRGGTYFTNAVTEIALSEGAVLDHVKVQQESTTAFHIANTQVVMAAKSNFTTHFLSLGGSLVRNEVRVRFDGEHAEATVNGLYLANGKQHIDNFTVIDHAKPNCASHELYKGILGDRAHGVFNGKILVRKDAQKTDAKQTNKVLLLSDDATINTKPQLEIFADDVKCTHGATIGQLDATQLFYLQSRGIPLDAARRLLTFAFANDVVNRIKIEAIRDELEKFLVHRSS